MQTRNPYLLDYYRTSSHVTKEDANDTESSSARIQNCVVRQLNLCHSMPRFIIVIPDYDILSDQKTKFFDYGARKMCDEITDWLINAIEEEVFKRKNLMKKIRPGSVMAGEPKIVYVKMIYVLAKQMCRQSETISMIAWKTICAKQNSNITLWISLFRTTCSTKKIYSRKKAGNTTGKT